ADTHEYPEGGFGWFVVLGAFLIHFAGISLIYITGVFIRLFFYEDVFPGATFAQLSWISAAIGLCLPVLGPVYGFAIPRLGPRVVCVSGALVLALGFELASLAQTTWQIVLTLGLLTGIGQATFYISAVSTLVQWFSRRRGLAMGIVASGTGLGALTLAPLAQALIDALGWRSALRVLGLITGTLLVTGGMLLKTRMGTYKPPFIDRNFFKNANYVRLYIFAFIQPFAFLFPYTYVPSYAVNIGLSASTGALALALMNAASSLGRIGVGYAADRFLGQINSYVLCLLLPPIFCLTLWTTCHSMAQLFAFAVLFGFFAGGFIVAYPIVLAQIFGPENLASRLGFQQTAGLVGQLCGPIIVATILDKNTHPEADGSVWINYVPMICYLAGMMLLNVSIIAWVR
ncbi:major facilitator superfamily domain-containing protein, partial [Hyaloraphidium curvatum]